MTFYKHLWGLARTITFAVPVTVAFLDCVGYVAKVEGASMQPVLNPNDSTFNDYVLLNRWSVRNYNISRGEIVSLSAPIDPDQKIIKRIIAVEGDTVNVLGHKRCYVKIPDGHCWVEGDHHGQSLDSNFFGPVAVGLIYAKASHIVWPPHRWQRLSISSQDHRITPKNIFVDLTMFEDVSDCPERITNTPIMIK